LLDIEIEMRENGHKESLRVLSALKNKKIHKEAVKIPLMTACRYPDQNVKTARMRERASLFFLR